MPIVSVGVCGGGGSVSKISNPMSNVSQLYIV